MSTARPTPALTSEEKNKFIFFYEETRQHWGQPKLTSSALVECVFAHTQLAIVIKDIRSGNAIVNDLALRLGRLLQRSKSPNKTQQQFEEDIHSLEKMIHSELSSYPDFETALNYKIQCYNRLLSESIPKTQTKKPLTQEEMTLALAKADVLKENLQSEHKKIKLTESKHEESYHIISAKLYSAIRKEESRQAQELIAQKIGMECKLSRLEKPSRLLFHFSSNAQSELKLLQGLDIATYSSNSSTVELHYETLDSFIAKLEAFKPLAPTAPVSLPAPGVNSALFSRHTTEPQTTSPSSLCCPNREKSSPTLCS